MSNGKSYQVLIYGFASIVIFAIAPFFFGSDELDADNKGYREMVNSVAKRIADIHGLKLKRPVDYLIISSDKLLIRIKNLVFEDYSPQEVIDEGRMMVRLGLFPRGQKYEDVIFDLLGEQVIGLYDTREKVLLVSRQTSRQMEQTTLNHEIAHAVQDQNFHLAELMKRKKGEGDRKFALSSVFEGDALLMEEQLSGMRLPEALAPDGIEKLMIFLSGDSSRIRKAPSAIRKSLLFPYSYGYVFIREIFKSGGYRAVNSVLRKLPVSTEQIIHPSKYFSWDEPVRVKVKLPRELTDRYRIAGEDVFGELGIKIWLSEHAGGEQSCVFADGWEGDWYVFLWPRDKTIGEENLSSGVFILGSVWEDSIGVSGYDEAGEFMQGVRKMLWSRWQAGKVKEVYGSDGEYYEIYRNFADEWIIIGRRGLTCLYVEGLPCSVYKSPEKIYEKIDVTEY